MSTRSCRLSVDTRKNKQREIITIRRSATCEDIFEPHEVEHACDFCRAKLDVFARNRNTSEGSCMKLWESKHAFSYHQGIALKHEQACECLGFPKGIDFVNECAYEKESSSSDTNTEK